MRSITRSLVFGLILLFGANAMAQFPNVLQINGTVPGCYPGQHVIVATTGATLPSYFVEVPVDASTCTFTVTLDFVTDLATFALTSYCAGVTTQIGSAQLNPSTTTIALVTLNCDVRNVDCEGVLNGPAMPGTACNDGNPSTQNDLLTYYCTCYGANDGECTGSWNARPVMNGLVPVPFAMELQAWSSGVEPITYTWTVDGQNIGTGPLVVHSFEGGGGMAHTISVTWIDANGCTGGAGDADYGMPCDGIGPSGNWDPMPCDDGNPNTLLDTWNNNCECVGVTDISNAVTVHGTVNGCTQTGQQVGIYVPSVFGGSMFTGPDCTYEFMFIPGSTATLITVSTSCDGGVTFQNTNVAWTPGMTEVVVDFTCPPDPPCTAESCFTIAQASGGGQLTPFTAEFTSCASGGVAPYAYSWWLPDGSASSQSNETFVFNTPGTYGVCLSVTDVNGCLNTLCDTLYVDANGTITTTPNNVDCLGIPGGTAVAGTPCVTPSGADGTWTMGCICLQNPPPCVACFTFNSPAPFVVDFMNCSTLPSGENDAQWELPDGSIYIPPPPYMFNSPSYTFDSPGVYTTCFTILDYGPIEGCTFCDTLYVDVQGNVSDTPLSDLDCLGIPGGTAVVGSPCNDGNPLTFYDMYMPNCTCSGVAEGECFTWANLEQVNVDGAPVPYETVLEAATAGAQPITYSWYFGYPVSVLEGTSTTPSWPRTFSAGESVAFRVVAVDADGCQSEFTNVEGLMSCDGILGSSAWPGLSCTDPVTGAAGIWSSDCECVTDPPCFACFTTTQSTGGGILIPFQADLSNCTTGGTAPYAYSWQINNGTVSTNQVPVITFPTPGEYIICLNVVDANGTQCTDCDTVYVDTNGNILENVPGCQACLTIVPATDGPAGPAIPWTVDLNNCSFGGEPVSYVVEWGDGETGQPGTHVYSSPGTYEVCIYMSAIFICEDVACATVVIGEDGTVNPGTTEPCEAEFFVMQAYEWVEEPGNPNGGGGEPIPNVLWVWNLSSGGTGFFQFTWSFGDGTSSTEAFPSHTYASGEYELCLTVTDNAGCTDTFCDMVSVDGDGILNGLIGGEGSRNAFTIQVMDPLATSVSEKPAFTELATWPNPVDNELNITMTSAVRGNARVRITDLSGRAVLDDSRTVTNGQNRLLVPVAALSPGLYLVQIGNGASTISSRFVKVR